MLKKSLMAAAVVAAFATTGLALAADAPAEEKKAEEAKGPHTLTGNFGIFSQYIFYAGTWMSNVSWLKENASNAVAGTVQGTYGGGGSLEADFYGGYKWSLPNDFVVDLGTLYYWYPGDINTSVAAAPAGTPKADTWELYVAPSWKWLSVKYSHSIKNCGAKQRLAVQLQGHQARCQLRAAEGFHDRRLLHQGLQL